MPPDQKEYAATDESTAKDKAGIPCESGRSNVGAAIEKRITDVDCFLSDSDPISQCDGACG
jgi:hypothetical protein